MGTNFERLDRIVRFDDTTTTSLRVLDFGGGDGPRVVVTCGVHGDEMDTGAVIGELRRMSQADCPAGTLRVVLGVNPLAVLERSRTASHDQRDLNRRFGSDPVGSYARAVADAMLELVDGAAVVIHLHQFETDAPMTAAYWDLGDVATRRRQWAALGLLNPAVVIWAAPDSDPPYAPFTDCVDAVMCRHGVPAVLIETSRFLADDRAQVERIARGIYRLWEGAAGLNTPRHGVEPVVRRRTRVDPPGTGVFESRCLPLPRAVEAGEVLGTWTSFQDLEQRPIVAPHDGLLTQLRRGGHVRSGDYLAIVCVVEPLAPDFLE